MEESSIHDNDDDDTFVPAHYYWNQIHQQHNGNINCIIHIQAVTGDLNLNLNNTQRTCSNNADHFISTHTRTVIIFYLHNHLHVAYVLQVYVDQVQFYVYLLYFLEYIEIMSSLTKTHN